MKKIVVFLFILLTSSLLAGWKWEQLETNNAPEYKGPMHIAYDNNTEKVVLVMQNEDIVSYDTWTFDGENWEYLCSYTGNWCSYNIQGGLVYDENLNKLTDYRMCSNAIQPKLTVFEISEEECWNPIDLFSAIGASNVSYDTKRARSVMLGASPNELATIEYDGQELSYYRLYDWHPPLGYLAYDVSLYVAS